MGKDDVEDKIESHHKITNDNLQKNEDSDEDGIAEDGKESH